DVDSLPSCTYLYSSADNHRLFLPPSLQFGLETALGACYVNPDASSGTRKGWKRRRDHTRQKEPPATTTQPSGEEELSRLMKRTSSGCGTGSPPVGAGFT